MKAISRNCERCGIAFEAELRKDGHPKPFRYCERCRPLHKREYAREYHRQQTGPIKGVIYVIGGPTGPVKIGWTRGNVEARLKQLQIGNPLPLSILKTMKGTTHDETDLHIRLTNYHIRGEWFEREVLALL